MSPLLTSQSGLGVPVSRPPPLTPHWPVPWRTGPPPPRPRCPPVAPWGRYGSAPASWRPRCASPTSWRCHCLRGGDKGHREEPATLSCPLPAHPGVSRPHTDLHEALHAAGHGELLTMRRPRLLRHRVLGQAPALLHHQLLGGTHTNVGVWGGQGHRPPLKRGELRPERSCHPQNRHCQAPNRQGQPQNGSAAPKMGKTIPKMRITVPKMGPPSPKWG